VLQPFVGIVVRPPIEAASSFAVILISQNLFIDFKVLTSRFPSDRSDL
jgi:hypothetical protein